MTRILLAQGRTRPFLDTGLHWGVSRWEARELAAQSVGAMQAMYASAFSGYGPALIPYVDCSIGPGDFIRVDSHDSAGPEWVPVHAPFRSTPQWVEAVPRPTPRSYADPRLSNRSER